MLMTRSSNGLHPALVGLLQDLPPPGTPFKKAAKKRFLFAFEKCLDVVYPEPEEDTETEKNTKSEGEQ